MSQASQAAIFPIVIVFTLVFLFMWFMNIIPLPVAVGGIAGGIGAIVAMQIMKKREHEKARRNRNHRRTAKS